MHGVDVYCGQRINSSYLISGNRRSRNHGAKNHSETRRKICNKWCGSNQWRPQEQSFNSKQGVHFAREGRNVARGGRHTRTSNIFSCDDDVARGKSGRSLLHRICSQSDRVYERNKRSKRSNKMRGHNRRCSWEALLSGVNDLQKASPVRAKKA